MPTATAELTSTAIRIPAGGRVWLEADIVAPIPVKGIVVFAHGSGSSRHSPRNRHVASTLNGMNFATVLADLLTEDEEQLDARTGALRFDIPLLTHRVVQMIDWLRSSDILPQAAVGLFGASTGAAAALDAAAARPGMVAAVVSRGGRPDLATELRFVKAPTLLIVGGRDVEVLHKNMEALRELNCPTHLEVVPGATHLFEEPGTLDAVAAAAGAWFQRHLGGTQR